MDTQSLKILIKTIIKSQSLVIGPLAIQEANQVPGLRVAANLSDIEIEGENRGIIENLVKQYEKLFGQASIEVCKDAVKEVLPQISVRDIPDILK